MSGGVDSSVAALLLTQQGYEVGGATFELFDGCPENNVGDAAAVCAQLGIPHYVLDYRELFAARVLDRFAAGYAAGETPNPCIACNRGIKFGAFLDDAERLGYELISTGHYAGVKHCEDGSHQLWRSVQTKKDQSYVLYHLSQKQLSRLILPLDRMSKDEVRGAAAQAGLNIHSKSDSQDICFVPNGDYVSFLTQYTGKTPTEGDFIDEQGNVLGRHHGIWRYTIGQRRGLGIALGAYRYVSALDTEKNTVTLSDERAVFSDTLTADELMMISGEDIKNPKQVLAKIRYGHTPAPATVFPATQGGEVKVVFDAPQRAVTAGQAVVFYDGGRVLGGAVIRRGR